MPKKHASDYWNILFMKLGAPGDLKLPQVNVNNVEYTGTISMGTQQQSLTVVWDTGSTWVAVEGKDCSTCYAPVYQYDESATYQWRGSKLDKSIKYGTTEVRGFQATDTVCLDIPDNERESPDDFGIKRKYNEACVDNFNIFIITEQKGMDNIDGIVGLATGFVNDKPMLIKRLKDLNKISYAVFGFSLAGMDEESFLDIGVLK